VSLPHQTLLESFQDHLLPTLLSPSLTLQGSQQLADLHGNGQVGLSGRTVLCGKGLGGAGLRGKEGQDACTIKRGLIWHIWRVFIVWAV